MTGADASGGAVGGPEAGAQTPPAADGAGLDLQRITCAFPGSRERAPYVALRDASLRVRPAEFVAVVGPTGCGKSTLLHVAAGLLEPTAGIVTVFGSPLVGINRHAGYMFQGEALMPWRTAVSNVSAGLEFRGVPPVEAKLRARGWLARVGLSGFEARYPHQLSGGMRKRVALAQLLILAPDILLMDEPFSALDVQTRQLMENELLELWAADRKCVVFVTHDLEEAIALADRVVVLSAGPETRVIADFEIRLPRPRDVAEVRLTPEFLAVHAQIWSAMKTEVLRAYARQTAAGGGRSA